MDKLLRHLVTADARRRELLLLEQRMTIKVGAMLITAVGILIAVLRIPHGSFIALPD